MNQFQSYSHFVVEGNIGAGKTSLAKILANKFNTHLVLEQFADNTFLSQFYNEPERFAFPLEMSFLAERFQQIIQKQQEAVEQNTMLIGDYLFEKSLLFARVNLKGAELDLFNKFYTLIKPTLRKPDLILYLHKKTDTLLNNIALRGRDFEKEIAADYLEKISLEYLEYLQSLDNQKVIILHSDNIDFVNNANHLRLILDLIQRDHPNRVQEIRLDT